MVIGGDLEMRVVEDGKELCEIHRYSNPISLLAKNALFALG